VSKSGLRLVFKLDFGSSSESHLLRNGLAAGGFSNASVAFTDGLVIKLETFHYLVFKLFCFSSLALLLLEKSISLSGSSTAQLYSLKVWDITLSHL